jgi:hypothetical protein
MSLTPFGRSAALLIGTLSKEGTFALTITAATRRPVKLSYAASPSAPALRDSIERAIPETEFFDDVHGSPDWRRHVTLRFAEEIRLELSEPAP